MRTHFFCPPALQKPQNPSASPSPLPTTSKTLPPSSSSRRLRRSERCAAKIYGRTWMRPIQTTKKFIFIKYRCSRSRESCYDVYFSSSIYYAYITK
ncbi:hypothetical protein COCNU_scaffold002866G000020 [Cocos nucifera]|nr:hypothetical protein [Cocos nucifera]